MRKWVAIPHVKIVSKITGILPLTVKLYTVTKAHTPTSYGNLLSSLSVPFGNNWRSTCRLLLTFRKVLRRLFRQRGKHLFCLLRYRNLTGVDLLRGHFLAIEIFVSATVWSEGSSR